MLCFRGENSVTSVAYVVRQREEEIRELKAQIAELQRSLVAQNRVISCDPGPPNRRKSRSSAGKLSRIEMAESTPMAGSKTQLVCMCNL